MVFLIKTNNSTVKKAKYPTFMNLLPVLACQFFKINFLYTYKTPFIRIEDLILKVKSDIVIILMNTDKKIFLHLKFTKTYKIDAY